MRRLAGLVVALLLFGIGMFYALNAFIQVRERGFAETMDVPIAIVSLVLGSVALWLTLRSSRTR